MAELSFIKTHKGLLPADSETTEYLKKLPLAKVLRGSFVRPRNPKFHAKFFAMLQIGFDLWEPGQMEWPPRSGRYIEVEKDPEEFRKLMIVKSGFYRVIGYPDGSVRARAKSIKFGQMEEDEFERLYSAVLDQIMLLICPDWPREEYENAVNQVLSFA